MLNAKVEEPFTVFTVLPRAPVPVSEIALASVGVSGNLLTYEVDSEADFFVFFRGLVSKLPGIKFGVL